MFQSGWNFQRLEDRQYLRHEITIVPKTLDLFSELTCLIAAKVQSLLVNVKASNPTFLETAQTLTLGRASPTSSFYACLF
jgi:hypothetical protein